MEKRNKKRVEESEDEEIVVENSDDEIDSDEERKEALTMGRVTNYDEWLERKTQMENEKLSQQNILSPRAEIKMQNKDFERMRKGN